MRDIYFAPDYHKNELLNVVIQKLAAPQSSPVEALIYYDTVSKDIWYYNGTVWKNLIAGTIAAANVTFNPASTTLVAINVQAAIEEIRTNNPKNNSTNAAPTVSDDNTQGYRIWSIWVNTSTGTAYLCTDASTGAAVWKKINNFTAAEISYDPTGTGLVATAVQAAITELDGRVTNLESASHAQNTDTGTTQTSFQIDSGNSGPRIKNEAGVLAVRNAGDTDYADLHVRNLTIDGEITEIAGNVVNTGDQEVVLNSDITTQAQNSDGRFSVKRLLGDNTTRVDAKLVWNESTDRWQAIFGDSQTTKDISLKHAEDIGDGVATQFDITHNLNTRDVSVQVFRTGSPYDTVDVEVERTTVNAVRIRFNGYTPSSNEFRVLIQG